jgi:anthranilate synthase component 2
MNILILDNYDSFTYNLVHYTKEILGSAPAVFRNDELSLEEVDDFDVIILSPGPGIPKEAGIMPELIRHYQQTKPILGVCLGHQAIAEAFGARLQNLKQVYHGKQTSIHITRPDSPLWKEVPAIFEAGRYHSWSVEKASLPACLHAIAVDEQGEIMAIQHSDLPVFGLQFHPESIMTDYGFQIMSNFLSHIMGKDLSKKSLPSTSVKTSNS